MRFLKIIILIACLGVFSAPARADESAYQRVIRTGVLRCGFVIWPPFFDMDPNTKKVSGLNADVINAIGGFLKLKVDYIEVTLGQQVEDLRNRRIDAMCGDAPWVLSSIKYLDYSHPYYYQGSYLFVRANETRIQTPADLNNADFRFIGIDGDVSSDIAMHRFPKARLKTLPVSTDSAQLLLELATGKADGAIVDLPSVARFEKSHPGKIRQMFKAPLAVSGGGFSVSKGESDLLSMLNAAVDAALNNGMVADVMQNYDPAGTLYKPVALPYR